MGTAGGGSSSGRIDFPDHMKLVHQDWLNQTGADGINKSVVDSMNAAFSTNPYNSLTAYDPSIPTAAMETAVGVFNTRVDALSPQSDFNTAVAAVQAQLDAEVFDDTYVTADIAAFSAQINYRLVNEVLPRFQGGMRDVNAVMSSAFVIGESIIESMATSDVAKYGTDLRIKFNIQRNDAIMKGVESVLRNIFAQVELEKNVAHYTIESNRMKLTAFKEKKDTETLLVVKGGRWDLETFQYGANLLAAIGGGTVVPGGSEGPSTTQSILGGALTGAAVGSNVSGGNGWATGLGAVVGGIAGGLS
jgi:hypothetical protein